MQGKPVEMPEESAEELYENAPCGYLSTAADGTIARANRTFLEWLGYTREELVNQKRLVDLLTMPGKVFHETHYAPLLHMQGFANEIALDLVCKDGHRLPTLLNSRQARTPDGDVWYTRISVFNATDRRRYERELLLERRKAEQAAKAKADFLATASHELRNQLHAIAAVTQLFTSAKKPTDEERYLKLLESSSSSLLALVNDILDYSKLEAGKLSLEERPFKLREMVHGVATGMQARAELRGLKLLEEIDEHVPPFVSGDAIKISQVLTNLVGNALKFTERGQVKITVSLHELGPSFVTLCFGVSDTGVGIPEELISTITEEFTAASREVSSKYRGTGLGLSICQRLLSLYGSSLQVSSEQGKGTTFSFKLRLETLEVPEARSMMGELLAKQTLRGVRVLVALHKDAGAGDTDTMQLTRLLERWGAEFELVDSGESVVDRVTHEPYDLVLMDTELAGTDGAVATRTIRELPSTEPATLPIIALGSDVEPGQRERLSGAGFTDFVGTPFESERLFRSIAMHASIHRALRSESMRH